MKRLMIAAAWLLAATGASAQTNVSIHIGDPGFYGRIDLGDFRQPPVVYTQPVIIERHARLAPEPLYLRVPPGHMKKWSKHCSRYGACGRQVYFVRDDWYTNTYAPRYRERYDERGGHGRGQARREEQSNYRDDGRRDEPGNGNGHGNGHGNGNGHGHGNGKGRH